MIHPRFLGCSIERLQEAGVNCIRAQKLRKRNPVSGYGTLASSFASSFALAEPANMTSDRGEAEQKR